MLNFIINPTAGKGKTLKIIDKIKEYCQKNNIEFKYYITDSINDATKITKKICIEETGDIVAVGGDGTVNAVLNGMSNFEKVRLGIIPYGTGNDFAKALKIPEKNYVKALEIIQKNEPIYTDFIELNHNMRVMNITGMGIDVDVLERYKRAKVFKGKFGYYKALIISLFKFKWNKFEIKFDGGEFSKKTAMITAVCNGKFFGGGIQASPESDVADGLLNIIIVNKINRLRIPMALVSLMRGKILKKKYVEHVKCKAVEIKTDAKPIINVDGELIKSLEFKCNIVQGKLKIFRN